MQRFHQLCGADLFHAVHVGNGAGNAQDAVIGAGAVAHAFKRTAQQLFGGGGKRAVAAQHTAGQLGVAGKAKALVALGLHGAYRGHPRADVSARLAAGFGGKGVVLHGAGLHMQVNAVQQRAGNPLPVALNRTGRAAAFPHAGTIIPALAGVHGGNQHKTAGVGGGAVYPAHGDAPVLDWLAQHLQRFAAELWQFVQKQYAVVGQADLAGAGHCAAARNGCGADTVVGAAERSLLQ